MKSEVVGVWKVGIVPHW